MSITPTPEPKYAAAWEPFIPYGDPASCPPDLKPGLDALVAKVGFMSNSMKLYLHNPGVLRAITAMGAGITSNDDGALDRTLKRKLAVICSATNGCVYCTAHQCDFLTRPPAGGAPPRWVSGSVSMSGRVRPACSITAVSAGSATA